MFKLMLAAHGVDKNASTRQLAHVEQIGHVHDAGDDTSQP